MKKRMLLAGMTALAAGAVLCMVPQSAQAAEWRESEGNLFYFDDEGLPHPNSFISYAGHVYYQGEADEMLTGWVEVDGVHYYLSESPEYGVGRLMAGGALADGLVVNESGQCVSQVAEDLTGLVNSWTDGSEYYYYIDPTPESPYNFDEYPIEYPTVAHAYLDGATARPMIVAAAESLLGVPYVWGGEDAAGVDCSGLVKYAYASVDAYVPHDAATQMSLGTAVTAKSAKAGDLAFYDWESDGVVDHVGICLGNGKVIEASSTYNQVRERGIGNPCAVVDIIGN